ncbi:MAG: DNA-formamidopyrimidine glycosylase [Erysipelotrichales bacterium]|nr:DNA-formamidopyrimidine glycosylase [Erysipelotrichales bacterium]
MPELPEVETVRRTLKNFILNKEIQGVDVYYDKIIDGDTDEFINAVTHQTIRDIDRVGKYLIFLLDDVAFVSHLRMEGKYHIVSCDEPLTKHTHMAFHLNDEDLRYIDTRKFGRLQLVDRHHYKQQLPLSKLGDEPFDVDEAILYQKLHRSSLPIKTALLDQSIMCGIGNIYANEICFLMKLDPRTKASRLSKQRVKELKQVSIDVLNKAIAQGGTTIHSFDANGIHGLFQVQLNVHTKKVCSICQSDIKKIMVHQRGTYYCPVCQKRRY